MKAIFLPKLTKIETNYFIKYENIPLAQICNSVISFDFEEKKHRRIKMFYEKFFSKYELWVNETFSSFVTQDYISDTNPRKKYRYKIFVLNYSMNSELLFNRYLKIDICIVLTKNKVLINKKQISHLWDLKTGYMQLNKHKKR